MIMGNWLEIMKKIRFAVEITNDCEDGDNEKKKADANE